ncbi:MAG: hypothetical protein HFI75_12180 [Lachnospiraceae bacterium]|nr:hypothetical protein [Lachnospiraceae bacterium]
MGYKNSMDLLPADLIQQIQKYVDGETIYIPRAECNRKKWGENSNVWRALNRRNLEIYNKYQSGVRVQQISQEYHISVQGIYKILSKFKT